MATLTLIHHTATRSKPSDFATMAPGGQVARCWRGALPQRRGTELRGENRQGSPSRNSFMDRDRPAFACIYERRMDGGPEQCQLEPRHAVDTAAREPESGVISPGYAQGLVRVSQ